MSELNSYNWHERGLLSFSTLDLIINNNVSLFTSRGMLSDALTFILSQLQFTDTFNILFVFLGLNIFCK